MIRELKHNPGLGESDHEYKDFQINLGQTEEIPPVKENYFLAAYERFESKLREAKEGCTPKSRS